MLQYQGMPRHKLLRKNTGIGVSFSPEDLDWLKSTYGKRHTITDLVRCAIHEAKCWRSGAPHPIPPPMAEPPPADPESHDLPPGFTQTSLTDPV